MSSLNAAQIKFCIRTVYETCRTNGWCSGIIQIPIRLLTDELYRMVEQLPVTPPRRASCSQLLSQQGISLTSITATSVIGYNSSSAWRTYPASYQDLYNYLTQAQSKNNNLLIRLITVLRLFDVYGVYFESTQKRCFKNDVSKTKIKRRKHLNSFSEFPL